MIDLIKGWLYIIIGAAVLIFLIWMVDYLRVAEDLDRASEAVDQQVSIASETAPPLPDPEDDKVVPKPELEPGPEAATEPVGETPIETSVVETPVSEPQPDPPVDTEKPLQDDGLVPAASDEEETRDETPEKEPVDVAPPPVDEPEPVVTEISEFCPLFDGEPFLQTLGGAEELEWQGDEDRAVLAPVGGVVKKLTEDPFRGKTLYLLDSTGQWCFLIGRLGSYAETLAEGGELSCGDILGKTGDGKLHLSVLKVKQGQPWWRGQPAPLTALKGGD